MFWILYQWSLTIAADGEQVGQQIQPGENWIKRKKEDEKYIKTPSAALIVRWKVKDV